MAAPVHLETGRPVARLVLDRPERRNALSLEVMRAVVDALDEVAADADVRVLVIEGTGPAFSAGHDLAEMVETRKPAFYAELFETCVELMQRLHTIPQPVIAKVTGVATAAGCQLVAACDLAVASDRRAVCDAGREHRSVLLDTDGPALARHRPEAGARDAPHRRR